MSRSKQIHRASEQKISALEPSVAVENTEIIESIRLQIVGLAAWLRSKKYFRSLKCGLLDSMNMTELATIFFLAEKDNVPISEIAGFADITLSSMTNVIDSLEKKNAVRRTPCTNDRRKILISLTESTRSLLLNINERHRIVFRNVLCRFSVRELKKISSILKDIAGRITVIVFCVSVFGKFVFPADSIATASVDKKVLTVEQAVALAVQNNPGLLQAREDFRAAGYRLHAARMQMLYPDMSLSAGANWFDPDTIKNAEIQTNYYVTNMPVFGFTGVPIGTYFQVMQDTNKPKTAVLVNPSPKITASVTKPLFTGGALWFSKELSKLDVKTKRRQLDYKLLTVRFETKKLFYNYLILQEQMRLMQELLSSLAQRREYIKTGFENGIRSEYEYINIRVQYLNTEPQLMQISNALFTAGIYFCNFTGLPPETELELSGSIYDASRIEIPLQSEDEIFMQVRLNNTVLADLQSAVKSAEFARKLQNASRMPAVAGIFQFNDEYKFDQDRIGKSELRSWQYSWFAGLTITLPLDDLLPGSPAHFKYREAAANVKKIRLARREQEDALILRARSLLMKIQESASVMVSQKENVVLAKKGYDMVNEQYKSGLVDMTVVNDSFNNYNNARLSELRAVYDNFASKIDLLLLLNMKQSE